MSRVRTANPTVAGILQAASEAGFFLLLAFAALAYGGIELWAESLLQLGAAALLVLVALRTLVARADGPRPGILAAVLVMGLALVYLQSVPLSSGVAETLSPRTAALQTELVPAAPEPLITEVGLAVEPSAEPRSMTMSLYPFATRMDFYRLLTYGGLLLAAMLTFNTVARVRRLCLFLAVFGAAVALLALVQRFTWDGSIYWSRFVGQESTAMGPFVSHNHYAGWINLCLGASLGLVLYRFHQQRWWYGPGHGGIGAALSEPRAVMTALLVFFMGLMAASVFVSLSRGGAFAFMLTGLVVVGLLLAQDWGRRQRLAILSVVVVGGGFILWFGWQVVYARLATLTYGVDWHLAHTPRLTQWGDLAGATRQFPIFGSGAGTHEFVYPMFATRDWPFVFTHAENEYLQTLLETGLVGLALLLVGFIVILSRGVRTVFTAQPKETRLLAAGLLFGVLTMLVHSVGDFGFHMPANALLFVVLAGGLCGLWMAQRRPARTHGLTRVVWAGCGVAVLVLTALAVVAPARAGLAAGLRHDAFRQIDERLTQKERETITVPEYEEAIAALESAIQCRPEEVQWRRMAARYRLAAYWRSTLDKTGSDDLARNEGLNFQMRGPAATAWAMQSWLRVWPGTQQYLVPAARHLLAGRQACPMLAGVHLDLAEMAYLFQQRDRVLRHCCQAAQQTGPASAEVWFRTGQLAHWAERPDEAWSWWKRSLALSDRWLQPIAAAGRFEKMTARAFCEKMALGRPTSFRRLADDLYAGADDAGSHAYLLERVVELLEPIAAEERSDGQMRMLARTYHDQGRATEAVNIYDELVIRAPNDQRLRYEFASVLCDLGLWNEARTHAGILREMHPSDRRYETLLSRIWDAQRRVVEPTTTRPTTQRRDSPQPGEAARPPVRLTGGSPA